MEQVEAIERATLDAVPPERLARWGDWLLPFDGGTVGRSHSAVPLRHATPPPDTLVELERCYREQGLATVLRLPELPAFEALQAQLRAVGYQRSKPTLVQVGQLDGLAAPRGVAGEIGIADKPGPDWDDVFLGEGFDPVDGASRLAILRRGRHSLFAGVHVAGRTVAVGAACLRHGLCGIHAMRTLPAWRGRGCATAVLAALAQAARERGVRQCFLQVEAGNAAARSLYAARGFRTAWGLAYWKRT
jgi:ribosomal protein S18 acetylase RimI-like enzyme